MTHTDYTKNILNIEDKNIYFLIKILISRLYINLNLDIPN